VWVSSETPASLRRRLASESALNCQVFWVPAGRSFGHDLAGIQTWGGTKPSLAEALRWRSSAQSGPLLGPLFVEGFPALHIGYGSRQMLWRDLQSLAGDCPVIILRRASDRGQGWVAESLPEEWLQGEDEGQRSA
jgi:hypothetical protein